MRNSRIRKAIVPQMSSLAAGRIGFCFPGRLLREEIGQMHVPSPR
jgi:hypothetical protein